MLTTLSGMWQTPNKCWLLLLFIIIFYGCLRSCLVFGLWTFSPLFIVTFARCLPLSSRKNRLSKCDFQFSGFHFSYCTDFGGCLYFPSVFLRSTPLFLFKLEVEYEIHLSSSLFLSNEKHWRLLNHLQWQLWAHPINFTVKCSSLAIFRIGYNFTLYFLLN